MMLTSPDRRRAASGFATIEVLVATVVILMVGTLAVVMFGNTDRRAVRLEAAETALFLQEARLRALEAGQAIEIVVTQDAIDAGGRLHAFANGMIVTPQEAQVLLQPTGQSEGLQLQFAKGDHVASLTLDWLTGRVAQE